MEEPVFRGPRAVNTKSVSMSGMYIRDVPVMDETCDFRKPEPSFVSKVVKEADFNAFGVFGVDGEVRTGTIPVGALWVRSSRPNERRQEFPSGR